MKARIFGIEPVDEPHRNPWMDASMRATLREQALPWMAANPSKGRPAVRVQGQSVFYPEDPLNDERDPYIGPPEYLAKQEPYVTHIEWVDVMAELKVEFGADAMRKQPELAEMAAYGVALNRTGELSKAEINELTVKKFGKRVSFLSARRHRVAERASSKSLKAAAKKEARTAKKGGETDISRREREHRETLMRVNILHEDVAYNMHARAHNRSLAEVRAQSQFVLDLTDKGPPPPARVAVPPRAPQPAAPRVVEPTAEDKARFKFQSWARQLRKRDRHWRFATALGEWESEKRCAMRAACELAAAEKLAAEEAALAARKPGASGPSKPAVWAQGAPGASAQSKVQGQKAASLERSAAHQQALEEKEKLRIAQLEEQREARRQAFEIGGSR